MERNKLILAAALLAATAIGSAARTWTLDQCIDYAIENNINVKQQQLSAYQGQIDVTAAEDAFLPRLSGYASQSYNFGRGLTADNTYANRNTSSFSVGASMSLPLFQGLRAIRSLEYSRTALRGLLERVESAKDDVTLNVISQYLQVLYAREMVQVQMQNLAISQGELARRQALADAGKLAELDIYQARAQVTQDSLSLTNARGDCDIALLDMAQLLNLPSAHGFDIAPLDQAEAMPLVSADDVYARALQNNHLIKSLLYDREAADRNLAVAQTGYIPTLSFSAGLGTNYYHTSGFSNGSFADQMKHNFAQNIGFSLSVPIFDAFSTRNSIRRAHAQQISTDLQLDQSRRQLLKAIEQAHTQAITSAKKYDAATVAADASNAAFEAMKVKYDNGRANATEYEKAKSDLINALAQQVQAKYENILRLRILNFYNK